MEIPDKLYAAMVEEAALLRNTIAMQNEIIDDIAQAVDADDIAAAIDDLEEMRSVKQAEAVRHIVGQMVTLNRLFMPRTWTREQSDAWHQNLPDVHAAFRALRATVSS